ncbi:MAG: sulfotransferase [Reinekea sp.]|nr:sulfotransferase [Reinekea sp.]
MGNGFWLAVGQMCQLCFWTVRYLPRGDWRQLPRRTLMFGLIIPVLVLFQVIHWLGFALDELLFRRFRQITVHQPIFVTGIPRSGTTHLHRVLAQHEDLTSMQLWECLFAPSITERYLYRCVGWLSKPLVCAVKNRKSLAFFRKMRAVHTLGLHEAEEDFIALLPVNGCFLLVLMFPQVKRYWQLVDFDDRITYRQKRLILSFYHRLLQKHLYFHGAGKRYLCKNPSFTSWIGSLMAQYPDACVVVCEREPQKSVPSQISSLQPAWYLLHGGEMPADVTEQFIAMLARYYQLVDRLPVGDTVMRLPMKVLVADLQGAVGQVLEHCHLPGSAAFIARLTEASEQAKQFRSAHHYEQSAGLWRQYASWFNTVANESSGGRL